jgi:hypothetical protein
MKASGDIFGGRHHLFAVTEENHEIWSVKPAENSSRNKVNTKEDRHAHQHGIQGMQL